VDPIKVAFILNMPPPTSLKQLRTTLVHIGYYLRFIRGYARITTSLEQLLKKSEGFHWNSFETLKENLSTTPILTFHNWSMEFHVHIDSYNIILVSILTQPGEMDIDCPIYFASQKLCQAEHNYTTIERKSLAMVYSLQKF